MLRKTPPLEAIEIFVAASRGGSFRAVGRELALSPSAVSRRIAGLESFLGIALFDRDGQSHRLSAAGRHYLSLVEPAIDRIQRATLMAGEGDSGRLRVAISHSLAVGWLIPRLADLRRTYGIDVEVIASRDFDVLRSGEAQVGIWGGLDVPQDMMAETILSPTLLPVSAPLLADGRQPPRCERDLADHVLLSVSSPGGLWERWLAGTHLVGSKLEIREFASLQLMYEAAAAGLGVALAIPLVAEPFLASARLLPCIPAARPIGETYRLYRSRNRLIPSRMEQRFGGWLREQVAESLKIFGEFCGGCGCTGFEAPV